MGVVSNKINIMELMKSGGGGDPTLPGRVSTLETETAGLIEANSKIMTSVSDMRSDLINTTNIVMDLRDTLTCTVTADGVKTVKELYNELATEISNIWDSLENGQTFALLYCDGDIVSPNLPGYYMYMPKIKGVDNFSSNIRCASIIQTSTPNSLSIRTCYFGKTFAYYSYLTINTDGTITPTTYDFNAVPTIGKKIYVNYKIY